jgi:hypothetical protein
MADIGSDHTIMAIINYNNSGSLNGETDITLVERQQEILPHVSRDKGMQSCLWAQLWSSM